jgi:hypothetical protein
MDKVEPFFKEQRAASAEESPERHCAPSRFRRERRKKQLPRMEPAVAFLLVPRSEVYLNLIWPDLVGLYLRTFY